MEKPEFKNKHGFQCYILLKEANIHINLICFDRNFDLICFDRNFDLICFDRNFDLICFDRNFDLICFDRNFDHPHINKSPLSTENSPKSPNFFPQKRSFLLKKLFDMYLRLGLSSFFVKIDAFFKMLLNCFTFEKFTKNIPFDCFGVRFVSQFTKSHS